MMLKIYVVSFKTKTIKMMILKHGKNIFLNIFISKCIVA